MKLSRSNELQEIYEQASDLAIQLEQDMSSLHLLLSLFIMPNKAAQVLIERGITEERLLALMDEEEEPFNTLDLIEAKAQQVAESSQSSTIDTLHLLVALTRISQSIAYQLLRRSQISIPNLRNQAMSYLTGQVIRRFDSSPPEVETVPATVPAQKAHPIASYTPTMKEIPQEHFAPLADGELDPKQFPWLTSLGRNLTQKALEGKIDPLIGRERELEKMIDILGKRRANNPCLIGEPGVGKTALAEGLALQMVKKKIPDLSGKILIELDMGNLLAGTQLRGSLAEKLKGIKDEVKAAQGNIIIFIDEIHTLVKAGSTGEGAQDASNDLKAALSKGEFPCVGATTIQEYKTYIETDPALARRFHLIWIEEPSKEETLKILDGVVPSYAYYHKVRYLPEALYAACNLTTRFLHDRRLPAKAIDIIDLAGSKARREGKDIVDKKQIVKVIAQLAGLPEEYLLVEDRERLLNMEHALSKQIIGHQEILADIAAVIRRNYAGFNGSRPIGSFLFLGPTGVGKTETAKAIARHLFHQAHSFVRIDMSEYQDASSVTRLIGAPPGYVGHDDGGQLTEKIRTKPYQLVLLDEIDKAHRDVLLILLQLLDEGHLTDGKGRRVSFSNCVIVMTSNLGSECFDFGQKSSIGFSTSTAPEKNLQKQILDTAKRQMPIELWNRIDARYVFMPLKRDEIREITRLMIEKSSRQLQEEKNISYTVSEEVVDWLIEHGGYHPELGARPMRRLISRQLESFLAHKILNEEIHSGDEIQLILNENNELDIQSFELPKSTSHEQKSFPIDNLEVTLNSTRIPQKKQSLPPPQKSSAPLRPHKKFPLKRRSQPFPNRQRASSSTISREDWDILALPLS